jgi:hypothetical protein
MLGFEIAQAADLSDPREAGARLAQATGAAVTCPGTQVAKAATDMRATFHGPDLQAFNQQFDTVYASWQKVRNCTGPQDPNPCRIIIQMSCQSAIYEIGPGGSIHPGLLVLQAAGK